MGLLLPLASQIVYQVGCKLGRGPDPGGCRGAAVQSWPFWSGVSGVCWAPRLPDSARFSGISLWTKLLTYIIVKQGVYWTGKPRMLDFAIPWSWKCWVNEMFFFKYATKSSSWSIIHHSFLVECFGVRTWSVYGPLAAADTVSDFHWGARGTGKFTFQVGWSDQLGGLRQSLPAVADSLENTIEILMILKAIHSEIPVHSRVNQPLACLDFRVCFSIPGNLAPKVEMIMVVHVLIHRFGFLSPMNSRI
jgi:hypothetical protein